ncbi:hypothetical protein JW707_03025 [Candidatus Woesearchaeota archaeon]|nr:hypothetical protein [Candidatus Woesearchaeota archaeon]
MIKETYEKYRKKYSLPPYDEVNAEMEISSFESEDFLLRQIRKKIAERVEAITTPLASILQPSADSLNDMHECRFFDDKEKGRIIDFYKKLMFISRMALEADISHDEKTEASVINEYFKTWAEVKNDVVLFLGRLKSCWEKETEIEEKLEYFG